MATLIAGTSAPRARRGFAPAQQSARSRAGNAAEALVETHHEVARSRGVAWLTKVPTPTAGRNGARRFVRRSAVDYLGHDAAGRALLVEVKRVTTKSFGLGRVTWPQWDALMRAHQCGARAVLVLVYGRAHDLYAVPFGAVADDAPRASLGAAWLARYRVPTGACYLEHLARLEDVDVAA